MKAYKVVVTGPFNAGKTEFVRAASDIDIVTTERRISDSDVARDDKTETTVAMDYGQKRMEGAVFHLYGTPGQIRFDFMWPILSKEMHAFILIVDSTDQGSLMNAMQLTRLFRKRAKVPYIVVANKQDGASPLAPDEIRNLLALPETVPVVPCVALDPGAVNRVLERVRQLLE
jgi:small GTP-binding protein